MSEEHDDTADREPYELGPRRPGPAVNRFMFELIPDHECDRHDIGICTWDASTWGDDEPF